MHQRKLEVNNILHSDSNQSERKIILKNDFLDFKVLINYTTNFLKYLWESPKLVADIIINSDIIEVKYTFANLFMNNFYENILSSDNIENNLIYVITLLIKDEINKMKNIDDCDMFLGDNSKVGYFMDELRKKTDIKYFFKTSFLNLISYLESMSSINFSMDIEEILNKIENNIDKENKSKLFPKAGNAIEYINQPKYWEEIAESSVLFLDQKLSKQVEEKEGNQKLQSVYLATLSITDIKKIIPQYSNMNPDMIDYLNNLINSSQKEYFYADMNLMKKFAVNKILSDKLISHYFIKFFFIKDFIDKFISIIKQNLILLPYPVKCFCKIISVLIKKKFPEINRAQKNMFISKLFFEKILRPILDNPGKELLINNFIISGYTLSNLEIINEILDKLFSFQLFEDDDDDCHINNYTPFNWYFLNKTPEIFEIFNKLTDIDLPPFINDLITDKLDPNFTYDYFKLNEEEIVIYNSICFNIHEFISLLKAFSSLKNKIDLNQYKNGNYLLKTFEKLNRDNNRKDLESLDLRSNRTFSVIQGSDKNNKRRLSLQMKDIKKKDFTEIIIENYYLFQNIYTNDKCKGLNYNLQPESKNNFYIKEKESNSENVSKNIIIKFKNFLMDLLYNIFPLKKSDFSQCNTTNTSEILNSIKNLTKLSNYNFKDTIPPEWYVESLLHLIKNIPEEYAKNDLEKLYDEMEEEIKESLNNNNFDYLEEYMNKIEFIKREKVYYEEILKILKDLDLNEKIKNIVENDFIPVKITFNYDNKNQNFDIQKTKIKKEDFKKAILKESKSSKSNTKLCDSIQSFISKFPDFSIFQERQDIDILKMQKELSVPKKLKDYFFSIIREHLTEKHKDLKNDDLVQAEYKIYDYVMSKINQKIFPKTYEEDDQLFKNIFKLSWTEPKHLIKGKRGYIFDAFLPEVIKSFHNLENELSPRKKIIYLSSIFNSITKVVKFNGGDNTTIGVDDQMPILSYCFIKAQPYKICSNLEFMRIFRNSLMVKGNDNEFTQLVALISFIKNLKYYNLIGITEEEFIKNCNDVINAG